MRRYILILLLGLVTLVVNAQDGSTFFINYLPALPLGKTADFNDNISPRGVDFEYQKFVKDDLSVGFLVGWNIFRQKITGETLEYEDLMVTGTQFRYTNTVPINVNVKKYFINENDIMPYVGVGLGTSYNERRLELGVFQVTEDKWLFNVAPEVGMLYDLNFRTYLSFKLKYNYSPKAGDFPSQSNLSLGIGLGLK